MAEIIGVGDMAVICERGKGRFDGHIRIFKYNPILSTDRYPPLLKSPECGRVIARFVYTSVISAQLASPAQGAIICTASRAYVVHICESNVVTARGWMSEFRGGLLRVFDRARCIDIITAHPNEQVLVARWGESRKAGIARIRFADIKCAPA